MKAVEWLRTLALGTVAAYMGLLGCSHSDPRGTFVGEQRERRGESELIPHTWFPGSVERIEIVLVMGLALKASDDPLLTQRLLDVLRRPIPPIRSSKGGFRDSGLPFAIWLTDGTVLIGDELRLALDKRGGRLLQAYVASDTFLPHVRSDDGWVTRCSKGIPLLGDEAVLKMRAVSSRSGRTIEPTSHDAIQEARTIATKTPLVALGRPTQAPEDFWGPGLSETAFRASVTNTVRVRAAECSWPGLYRESTQAYRIRSRDVMVDEIQVSLEPKRSGERFGHAWLREKGRRLWWYMGRVPLGGQGTSYVVEKDRLRRR